MEYNDNFLSLNKDTQMLYDDLFSKTVLSSDSDKDIADIIKQAVEMENQPVLMEGITAALKRSGFEYDIEDKDSVLAEIKRRYKNILGISCPRTVIEWIKGTTPGTTNHRNNYELCFALEMNFQQTSDFFRNYYLTQPFNVKNRTDAVFMYAFYHKKPYTVVSGLLEKSKDFEAKKAAHTSTAQIVSVIYSIDDDDEFLNYLSEHCYGEKQHFQYAKNEILKEIKILQKEILNFDYEDVINPERMNSVTIEKLLGYKYQSRSDKNEKAVLPKRFTESLPNDATLGQIINGEKVSYELLRKTLMLLNLHNFFKDDVNTDEKTTKENLRDFLEGLNNLLTVCGFSQVYLRHPFDFLLLNCANSDCPTDAFYRIAGFGRNWFL